MTDAAILCALAASLGLTFITLTAVGNYRGWGRRDDFGYLAGAVMLFIALCCSIPWWRS